MPDDALWIVMLDAGFGVLQWALILRFIYSIFVIEDSRLFGIRHLNKATSPLIRLFSIVTPDRLIARVRPLYVAFYFLIIRFYVLPTLCGYQIKGLSDLSLEALFVYVIGQF